MNFDFSAITSKLALVLPYFSYIINMFSKMFETMQAYLNG